jgi:hypothetical protein
MLRNNSHKAALTAQLDWDLYTHGFKYLNPQVKVFREIGANEAV